MALKKYRRQVIRVRDANDELPEVILSTGDEAGRIIQLVITGGENYGTHCRFWLQKEEGLNVYQDMEQVTASYPTWEAAINTGGLEPGVYPCMFRIGDNDGSVTETFKTTARVLQGMLIDAEESEEMQSQLSEFEQRTEDAITANETATAAANDAAEAATTATEAIEHALDEVDVRVLTTGVLSVTNVDGVPTSYDVKQQVSDAINPKIEDADTATQAANDAATAANSAASSATDAAAAATSATSAATQAATAANSAASSATSAASDASAAATSANSAASSATSAAAVANAAAESLAPDVSALKDIIYPTEYLTSTWEHGNINSYGENTGNAAYMRSDFIRIPDYFTKLILTLANLTYSDNLRCYVYVYDATKTFISPAHSNAAGVNDITSLVQGGYYIRCVLRDGTTEIQASDIPVMLSLACTSLRDDTSLSKASYFADAKTTGDKIINLQTQIDIPQYSYAMTKILCIGDSLTRGSSPMEDWGVTTGTVPIAQNYPYMIGRMINAITANAGFSGISASSWYINWADEITPTEDKPYKVPHYNFADYDTYIIWLGTNNGFDPDDLDTDGTEANYYCKIIDAILNDYAAGHTDVRYGDTPQIILCKCFATKSGYSLVDTNAAIEAIATRYNLPVIDNSDLGYATHPELHENTNNPHFGKAGYIFIADRINRYINAWINQYPIRADFAQTQFPFASE